MKVLKTESGRVLFLIAVVVTATTASLFLTAPESGKVAGANPTVSSTAIPAATFNGANVGAIPDGTSPCWNPGTSAGGPREVTFNVTGMVGPPSAVDVSVTFGSPNHSFMGDVTAILIAPNGASHSIFGHTGATTATAFGDASDLGALYAFSDVAPAPPNGGWWQASTAAGTTTVMPTGTYRTTAPGGAGAVNPQPPTNMNAAFAGVANANGTWTLRLTDNCAADTGAVTAANLSLTPGTPVPADANADFDGDDRTDYTIARAGSSFAETTGSAKMLPGRLGYSSLDERPSRSEVRRTPEAPEAPPIFWWILYNNSGAQAVGQIGDAATDFITPEDFDGDGKDDLAVWTSGAPGFANFKILQSTTNTVAVHVFGQDGDDPAIVGDYDGDNKADQAVYRCPSNLGPAGQCFFFYRGSLNNPAGNITYVPWGFGVDGDFFPYVGDQDGDGKHDFSIQRADPGSPSNGQFVTLRSGDLGTEYINWGLSSDFLIPGDYDGDGTTDLVVRRTVTGNRIHFIRYRTGATNQVQWGITGDSSVPGDYDGDGRTDLAIWRGSVTPGQSRFWVLNSGSGTASQTVWGQCPTVATCDFAVAGWAVH